MKKNILCLLISSILLVQCFSPLEITKNEFLNDSSKAPLGVITKDKKEYLFKKETAIFKIESDSLLIVASTKIEPNSGLPYFGSDTLQMKNIESIYVSKFDGVKTSLLLVGTVGVFIGLLFISMSGSSSAPVLTGSF